jgi:hypothetical protein
MGIVAFCALFGHPYLSVHTVFLLLMTFQAERLHWPGKKVLYRSGVRIVALHALAVTHG